MSVVNSTAANAGTVESIEKTKNKAGEASPGTITLPKPQVAPEIENAGQNTGENGNPDILPDRMAVARAKRAELRAAGLMKTPLEKFLDDPRPLRAIRRFCYECNGYCHSAATNCENASCPLWLFRRGSSIIREAELPKWRKAYREWMKTAGELGRVSDDVETGADEAENSATEEE